MALAVILAATTIVRFTLYPGPLWLDETWTGVIVTQQSLAGFIHRCAADVNGPLYSVLAALWALGFGVSDRALRSLPAIFGVLVPLAALAPLGRLDRKTRLVWSALLACWIPGLLFSAEARPYTLTLLLGVANSIAFARLMDLPGRPAAWAWASLSSLFMLAHYFVAPIVALQAVVYLAVHRRRALATWDAALAFLPVPAVLASQIPSLLAFSTPRTSWIRPVDSDIALSGVVFLFGVPILAATTAAWLAISSVIAIRTSADPAMSKEPTGAWIAAGCVAAAVVAALVVGVFRPVFVDRYLTGYVPGVMLGLALTARRYGRKWALSAPALVAPFAVVAALWAVRPHGDENQFSWEGASDSLAREHVTRLAFLWDTPMGADPDSIRGLGRFFFWRAGHRIPVDPVILSPGQDPNLVLSRLSTAPGSGIIWVFDKNIPGTASLRFPPRLTELNPRLECRDLGGDRFGIITCHTTDRAPLSGGSQGPGQG